jgi:hypothetical protein
VETRRVRQPCWRKQGIRGSDAGNVDAVQGLSLCAERTRRWRERRQQGVVVVSFDVAPDITAKLIRLGWLDATKRGDKAAIAMALIELAEKATELEVTPVSCSM